MTSTGMPIVRVAILTDNRLTELALPTELPLREIVPAVHRLVGTGSPEGQAADPEEVTQAYRAQALSLAPIGGAPFSLDASLDTVGVVDGDLLALQQVPLGPAAPGIVEDIADAAVIFSAARRTPWGSKHIQVGAVLASIALALAATGLAVGYRLSTGSVVGLAAAAAIAALTAVVSWWTVRRAPRSSLAFSGAALVPVAAALALSVPGGVGPAQVLLAAAGMAAWSVLSMVVSRRESAWSTTFFTTVAVAAAGVMLAAGAQLAWQLGTPTLGCGLIAAALLVTVAAAQLSAFAARFPLPVIPAPGDPTPAPRSLQVLADLPRRVLISAAHQTGFIAAAVLLSVLGSVAIAWWPATLSGWGWYVVLATAAGAVLRARIWDCAACKACLLAQPYLVGVTLVARYAAAGHYGAAVVAALVLGALTLVWVLVALNPRTAAPESYALPVRRLLGFVASGLDASLIPVLAYLVGAFGWVLNR